MNNIVDGKTGLGIDKLVSLNDMIAFVNGTHKVLTDKAREFKMKHGPDQRAVAQVNIFQDGLNAMHNALLQGLLTAQAKKEDDKDA